MPKKLIAKSEWGMALHTALRKCCDSDATTIAYCAISDMQVAWELYIKYLAKAKCKGDHESLRELSLKWKYREVPTQEMNMAIILHTSFELFSIADWQGYAEFLKQ